MARCANNLAASQNPEMDFDCLKLLSVFSKTSIILQICSVSLKAKVTNDSSLFYRGQKEVSSSVMKDMSL